MSEETFKADIESSLEDVALKQVTNDHDYQDHAISEKVHAVSEKFLSGKKQELMELKETFSNPKGDLKELLEKELLSLKEQSEHTPVDAGKRDAVKGLIEQLDYEQSNSEREDIEH